MLLFLLLPLCVFVCEITMRMQVHFLHYNFWEIAWHSQNNWELVWAYSKGFYFRGHFQKLPLRATEETHNQSEERSMLHRQHDNQPGVNKLTCNAGEQWSWYAKNDCCRCCYHSSPGAGCRSIITSITAILTGWNSSHFHFLNGSRPKARPRRDTRLWLAWMVLILQTTPWMDSTQYP